MPPPPPRPLLCCVLEHVQVRWPRVAIISVIFGTASFCGPEPQDCKSIVRGRTMSEGRVHMHGPPPPLWQQRPCQSKLSMLFPPLLEA